MIERLAPATLPDTRAFGFAQITVTPPKTKLVHIAGQFGASTDGTLADGYEAQLEQTFSNLRAALDAVGAKPEDVAKVTILSVDHTAEKQALVSAARNRFWPAGKPASTLIPVPRLALDGMLFEIDATVVVAAE